jgi:hypothetical protein
MAALARAATTFDMTPEEAARYRTDGYIMREAVFSAAECAQIAADCEALLADLTARGDYERVRTGTFTFDRLQDLETTVKWERQVEGQVRGLEPFAHLSAPLNAWGLDPRLTAPCRAACEADEVVLFTEKLNMKRAGVGGTVELHQDYPYWAPFAPHAGRVVTAMLYLDDATRENGCLEVAAASHRAGQLPQRTDVEGFDRLQMRQDHFGDADMTVLEGTAGAVIWFSAFLAHRSAPNWSTQNRRALLYSYQPAGFPHGRVLIREARERAAKRA